MTQNPKQLYNFNRTLGCGSFAGQVQCNENPFFIAAPYYSCEQQSSFNRETHEKIVVKNNCGKQGVGADKWDSRPGCDSSGKPARE